MEVVEVVELLAAVALALLLPMFGVLLPAGREVLSGKETLKTSGGAAWQGRMVVLVDRNTGNTGELLAGILRSHGGAARVAGH